MYTIEYKGTPFLFILKHVESAVEKLVTTQITLTPSDSIEMILRRTLTLKGALSDIRANSDI